MNKRNFVACCIPVITLATAVLAHVEHFEEVSALRGFWWYVFLWHDWLHPFFFLFMILTCYSMRFFAGREVFHEPRDCVFANQGCGKCYRGEHPMSKFHRFFYWGTLILLFIHFGETSPALFKYLLAPANPLYLDNAILLSESIYLFAVLAYLGGCYHFRYFIGKHVHWFGRLGWNIYGYVTRANRHHDTLLWLTFVFVALRFTLVLIQTGSLLKAIPGTV
ncbi:hypothetical protein HY641_02840 [Candidatus Woesearchaeota archaeon]|nr:hypothetical protein [Candidatus Woesearchaeota archaeon]